MRSAFLKVVEALHALYKYCLSPLFGNACRFTPSCSDYFLDALRTHGFLRGVYLGIRRLLRCQALHPGGFDPVPAAFESKQDSLV